MSKKTIYLKDYQPPVYLIQSTYLVFELDYLKDVAPEDNYVRVSNKMEIYKNPQRHEAADELRLHGDYFELLELYLDGKALSREHYQKDEDGLLLKHVPQRFTLEVVSRLQAQKNTALEGLYQSNATYCTQCEAEGFRRFTYYLDQPDVMSVFTTKIIADHKRYPVMLSNGNLIEQGEHDNERHYVVWHDPFKKPSYLFALVAGKLACVEDTFTTCSGKQVRLQIYVESHNLDKCDHAMASLKRAMKWDEQTYGLEYDLDIYMIVAIDDFNMGAMENKGLNIFNAKYVLARPETATDKDYEHIEGVIAHEYFHNWTGNRVTCRDWFQLSLKEGLTVFRDQEFTADMQSRAVKRIDDVKIIRTHQFAEDASPMAHPVRPSQYMEINNFYTVTVYNKGAEVVRMIQTIIGRENFRKGLELYFQRHDGQAVTTEDFVAAMADASGYDLDIFQNWYHQAGTPTIRINTNYDSKQSVFHITVSQKNPLQNKMDQQEPLHIPIKIGIYDQQGNELVDTILHLKNKSAIYSFSDIHQEPVLSVLRDFSAPVIVDMQQSADDLAFLMAYDKDSFNRWDAGQRLMCDVLLLQIQRIQNEQQPDFSDQLFQIFIQAFEKLLLDEQLDPALKALALSLPDTGYLLDQLEVADVDAVYMARKSLQQMIARELKDSLLQVYQQNLIDGDYTFTPYAAGSRSLRKTCLYYLLSLQQEIYFEFCYRDYLNSNNMTDSINALVLLNAYQNHYQRQVMADFEQRWIDDPLVMDKWLSIQAMSEAEDCLENIKNLMHHKTFDIKNPNRVRALISTFAASNYLHFHRIDGSGYQFIADRVIEIDRLNPQVAARLVKNFSRWRRFCPGRQEMMCQQLQRILEQKHISPDVYEICSMSLENQESRLADRTEQ